MSFMFDGSSEKKNYLPNAGFFFRYEQPMRRETSWQLRFRRCYAIDRRDRVGCDRIFSCPMR